MSAMDAMIGSIVCSCVYSRYKTQTTQVKFRILNEQLTLKKTRAIKFERMQVSDDLVVSMLHEVLHRNCSHFV